MRSAGDRGTLYQLRNRIHRSNVPSIPKKDFNACEDFLDTVISSHVVAAAMATLQLKSSSDTPDDSVLKDADQVWTKEKEERKAIMEELCMRVFDKFISLSFGTIPSSYIHSEGDGVSSYSIHTYTTEHKCHSMYSYYVIAHVCSTQSHGDSDGSECANDGGHETDPESFESTQVTHTVTFNCIGCTREHQYQETLALAHQLLKQNTDVPVRLFHEENNRYDSRALAIQCQPDGGEWKRIGYIVKEALEETHI